MTTLLWILTVIGALIGGLFLFVTLISANGAPQEAAGAALALGFAAIPYVLARAVSELTHKG